MSLTKLEFSDTYKNYAFVKKYMMKALEKYTLLQKKNLINVF